MFRSLLLALAALMGASGCAGLGEAGEGVGLTCLACVEAQAPGVPLGLDAHWYEDCEPESGFDCVEVPYALRIDCGGVRCDVQDRFDSGYGEMTFYGWGGIEVTPRSIGTMLITAEFENLDTGEIRVAALDSIRVLEPDAIRVECRQPDADVGCDEPVSGVDPAITLLVRGVAGSQSLRAAPMVFVDEIPMDVAFSPWSDDPLVMEGRVRLGGLGEHEILVAHGALSQTTRVTVR